LWHVRGGKCVNIWRDNLRERENLEDIDIVERVILKWIIKNKIEGGRLI
jgi:hypothetical protein